MGDLRVRDVMRVNRALSDGRREHHAPKCGDAALNTGRACHSAGVTVAIPSLSASLLAFEFLLV
jgi:hypothetical protein